MIALAVLCFNRVSHAIDYNLPDQFYLMPNNKCFMHISVGVMMVVVIVAKFAHFNDKLLLNYRVLQR